MIAHSLKTAEYSAVFLHIICKSEYGRAETSYALNFLPVIHNIIRDFER